MSEKELTDVEIARVAASISTSDLEDLAVKYLGFTSDRIVDVKDQTPGGEEAFKREILIIWRKRSEENTVKNLASILYKASKVKQKKIEEILKVSKEEALTRDIKKRADPVSIHTGYRPPSIHNAASELTDKMLLSVSERITNEGDLVKLGVSGLKMNARKVIRQMDVTSDINTAAYVVLKEWLTSRPDREKAYEELCTALKSVNMMFFMKALDGNLMEI